MPPKRQILWLPLILALGGILLLLITVISYSSWDGGRITLPGYKLAPEPVVAFSRWKFFILSGLFLLMLLALFRWSIRPSPSPQQEPANIGCFLAGCVIVVTCFLLLHFAFTVCA